MKTLHQRCLTWLVCLTGILGTSETVIAASHRVVPQQWKVAGQERTGFVAIPVKPSQSSPVVVVYHGHGGRAERMIRRDFHSHWPQAVVVYPQGLPATTSRDPDGKRPGWQNRTGLNNDRDLKLFDAILETLRKDFEVDNRRVFVTGHSNGGGMTGLLWANRHDQLAGVAISAGGIGEPAKLKPLPVFHLAGRHDTIVRFANQERSIAWFKTVNAVDAPKKAIRKETESFDHEADSMIGITYSSPLGTDVVVHIHDGGHEFIEDAPERIIRFFKTLERPENGYPDHPKLTTAKKPRSLVTMRARFRKADKNTDGKVTREELPMPKLFQHLDKNQDGFLTLEEISRN